MKNMNEELINFEGNSYINPQVGLDESNAFIDNLRQAQATDTARINQQTYGLGTQVPSNLGGLSGSEATFAERYQVPQVEQMIANLKTTAQTQALNQALENTLAQYKNRYQQAYRNARAKALTTATGGSGYNEPDIETDVIPEKEQVTVGDTEINVPSNTRQGFTQESSDINTMLGGAQLPSGTGTPYYFVTKDGRVTGIRVYASNHQISGIETPATSYTGQGGESMLRSVVSGGGKIYNAGGKDVTTGWQWLMTH